MAEKKYSRNAVDYMKTDPKYPKYRLETDPEIVKNIVQVDRDTVPGAELYSEAKWIMPGSDKEVRLFESHTHEFGVLIGFFGFNYDDIQGLGAEIEFTVDNETHKVTKSFASYVPAGVQHGPLIIRNVARPIFHFMTGRTSKYE
jgi:hypothetical protein